MKAFNFIDDEIIIPIYKEYIDLFDKCEKISVNRSNLMGLIFHELMYNTSIIVYNKFWYNQTAKIEYPFLGYRKNRNNHINKILTSSLKRNILSRYSKFISKSNYNIGILNPTGLEIDKLLTALVKHEISFSFINTGSVYIENYTSQLDIIESNIQKIWDKFNLNYSSKFFFLALKQSFKLFLKTPDKLNKYDALIIGTPVRLPIRIEACSALSRKIPTICLDHGNESGTADHPSWGYNDQSYCSHFIGYGPLGGQALKGGDYTKSLFNSGPKYYESSSLLIENLFNNLDINILDVDFVDLSIMYVPNRLEGCERIGPFYSIKDEDYIDWQEYLLDSFSNLVYKKHPKQKIEYSPSNCLIIDGVLEDHVNSYDVFITDTILSTAFANIAASNKPIIYFNIGFGNISRLAEKAIRERVIWIDIDLNNPGDLKNLVLKNLKKEYNNAYTKQFSISEYGQTKQNVLINIIKELSS